MKVIRNPFEIDINNRECYNRQISKLSVLFTGIKRFLYRQMRSFIGLNKHDKILTKYVWYTLVIKKFRKKYKLELIPASHEGIILGTCVWVAAIGKPKFSHKGMPEHILNAFVDADVMTREEWLTKHAEAKNHALKEAHFAERTIEWDVKGGADAVHSTIGKLGGKFDLKKVTQIFLVT